MARARNIKPSFFKNELLGEADPLLGLLFISLWTLADKAGRLEDRPLRIKAETFPYRENIDINGYLTQLLLLGFIDRYKAVCDGKEIAIIEIVNFTKHQTPHSTEKASELPCKPIDKPITLINGSAAVNGHINVLIPDSSNTDSLSTDSHTLENEQNVAKNLTIAEPTLAASVCFSMKEQGLVDINPINPTFLALINAGASREEFVHAASQAKNSGKGFSYAIGIVKKQREDVAKLILHQGAMPTAPPKKQTIHDKRTATAKAMFGGLTNEPEPRVIDVSSYETEAHRALISSSG